MAEVGPPGVKKSQEGYRLIFSDSLLGGGQVVKTFKPKATAIKEVVQNLRSDETFMFEKICTVREVDKKGMSSEGNGLLMHGIDGHLRRPLRSDKDVKDFLIFEDRTTPLPTVEIILVNGKLEKIGDQYLEELETTGAIGILAPPVAAGRKGASSATPAAGGGYVAGPVAAAAARGGPRSRKAGSAAEQSKPLDIQERLEDENEQLKIAKLKTERDIKELERKVNNTMEQAEAMVDSLEARIMAKLKGEHADVTDQFAKLRKDLDDTRTDLANTKTHVAQVEKADKDGFDQLSKEHNEHANHTHTRFEDVDRELSDLKLKDQELAEEDQRKHDELSAELKRFRTQTEAEAKRIATEAEEKRKSLESKLSTEMKTGFEDLSSRLEASKQDADTRFKDLHEMLDAKAKELDEWARDSHSKTHLKFDDLTTSLRTDLTDGFERSASEMEKLNRSMGSALKDEVDALSTGFSRDVKELANKLSVNDTTIHKRAEALTLQTEKTFNEFKERLEEMGKMERQRLANMEKNFTEVLAKTRSDFRIEVERLRGDVDQEQDRLDQDLSDLHTKHDLTKQEINFFQSKMRDLKEWAQRSLNDLHTALKATGVDSQEGLQASQKMLHALRDDAVSFREKMAKYVSLLQHSSDSHSDAIASIEQHRQRMRMELNRLMEDHNGYTKDMDGWADDVRVKVERLFRAAEPYKAQWVIKQAAQKLKNFKKPTALKSKTFTLKGLRGASMEFYPSGTNQSPEGKAVLRILFPSQGHVRFQCLLGKETEGTKEFNANSDPRIFTMDLIFDGWKDHVREDGTLNIGMDILADCLNSDETLSPQINIETVA
jgi:hypothetical protein